VAKSEPPRADGFDARHRGDDDPPDRKLLRALDWLFRILFLAGFITLCFAMPADHGGFLFAPSTEVILVAVGSALVLVAFLPVLYAIHRRRRRVAPDESGVEGSRQLSGSEPGQIVVPDYAPADTQHAAWTSPEPDARTVPDVGRGAGPSRRRLAWWITALGLTVVALTAWFVVARTSGGSRAGASSVEPTTAYSSVGPTTAYSPLEPTTENPKAALRAGVCFNYVDQYAVNAVPCAQGHDHEAYYRHTLPPGPYPGNDAVFEAAYVTCHAQFDRYLGPGHPSEYYISWMLMPDRSEWAAGNRITICVLSRSDQDQYTGSAHQAH
jgi:hypothetical protein